jgi:hypothetical protein
MSTTIVWKDDRAKDAFIKMVNTGQQQAQSILEAWNRLPLRKIKTVGDMEKLTASPSVEKFAAGMIPDASPTKFMGIPLKAERVAQMAVEMMDVDFSEVKGLLAITDRQPINTFYSVATMTKNGLEVDKKQLDKQLDIFVLYAVSEKEKDAAETIKQALEAINKLVDIGGFNSANHALNHMPSYWLSYNNFTGKIDVKPEYFKTRFST